MQLKFPCLALLASIVLAGCAGMEEVEPDFVTNRHHADDSAFDEAMAFDAVHAFEVEVPAGTQDLKVWFAIPDRNDPHQLIEDFEFESTLTSEHFFRKVQDSIGNEFLLLEAKAPAAGRFQVTMDFEIDRLEVTADLDPAKTRPHTAEELAALRPHLIGDKNTVVTPQIRALAMQAVGAEKNPITVARRLYDAVLDHIEYHVKDPKPNSEKTMNASGRGSSVYAFEECTGNCTDIHSLYAAMAHSVGLPVRAVYGSFFKGPLNGQDKDQSYHCWLEFHAPGQGWIALDVAVADVFVADFTANENSAPRAALTTADGYKGPDQHLVDYYFGNLDARRVVWHRGRDLVMVNPRQSGDPLPWLPKAYAEADGQASKVSRKLTYESED